MAEKKYKPLFGEKLINKCANRKGFITTNVGFDLIMGYPDDIKVHDRETIKLPNGKRTSIQRTGIDPVRLPYVYYRTTSTHFINP